MLPTSGSGAEAKAEAVPGATAIPDMQDVIENAVPTAPQGAVPGVDEPLIQEAPSEQPEIAPVVVPNRPKTDGGVLKLTLIVGGAFLAYKIGMLDNILSLVGMGKSAEPIAMDVKPAEPDPGIPTIDSVAVKETKTEDLAEVIAKKPATDQSFDPLEDPRMKEMNAEVEAKIAARDKEFEKAKLDAKTKKQKADRLLSAQDEDSDDEYLDDWVFKGRIYDMISLKPVAGASLMLMDKHEEQIFTADSDAKGRYEFDVPEVEGGYHLVVDHAYYLADYWDEKKLPYHKTPMSQRRQLRSSRPRHKPWIGGEKTVRRDIVLFPEIPDR